MRFGCLGPAPIRSSGTGSRPMSTGGELRGEGGRGLPCEASAASMSAPACLASNSPRIIALASTNVCQVRSIF